MPFFVLDILSFGICSATLNVLPAFIHCDFCTPPCLFPFCQWALKNSTEPKEDEPMLTPIEDLGFSHDVEAYQIGQ